MSNACYAHFLELVMLESNQCFADNLILFSSPTRQHGSLSSTCSAIRT